MADSLILVVFLNSSGIYLHMNMIKKGVVMTGFVIFCRFHGYSHSIFEVLGPTLNTIIYI